MIKFEDFNFLKNLCNLTTTPINIGPRMVEAMHNIVLQAIKVTILKTTYISMSCDKVTTIDN
jgi:hypothetical protein